MSVGLKPMPSQHQPFLPVRLIHLCRLAGDLWMSDTGCTPALNGSRFAQASAHAYNLKRHENVKRELTDGLTSQQESSAGDM